MSRPLLRYHGGKWKIAPWIIEQLPEHRIYVEPYGGGASVLLRKPRAYAEIYNDLWGEVVNLFRVLRNPEQARGLVALVELTPYAREEFELSQQPADDPVEQARRTLLRSAAGFASGPMLQYGTGFRTCFTRSYNTAADNWASKPASLDQVIERLRGVVIEHSTALDVIRRYDTPDTLFYCDPPYVWGTRNRRNAGHTYRHEMSDADHVRLAEVLASIAGMAVVSGYPCALYEELYAGWQRVERCAHADGARDRVEVLWISPRASR
ncbi:MAG: DNA adenine methylase [Caldilineaceae bacterium]